MTPYLIFVIALTVAYIIYYGYNISKDLYGKKGQAESIEETFDVGDMEQSVVATPVRETDDGFSLGADSQDVFEQPVVVLPEEEEPVPEPQGSSRVLSLTEKMDEADVQSEGGIPFPELDQLMMDRHSDLAFRKSTIKQKRETF